MDLKVRKQHMISRQLLISGILIFGIVTSTVANTSAQISGSNELNDQDQPGKRLQMSIMKLINAGIAIHEAVDTGIDNSLSETESTLNSKAKTAVTFDLPLANQFYLEMIQSNNLFDVSKILIELNPDKAEHVISLGVILYPEFVNEIFNGAALTGIINVHDIIAAAVQAGADPKNIYATDALYSTKISPTLTPIGAGIGAGGSGAGDATASAN